MTTNYWDEIETSLTKLNKATNMEWTHEETGGGCDCFWLQLSHGYFMLTRDASAPTTDEDYDCLSLGWYKEDDCEGAMVESVTNLSTLIEWAQNR